MHDVRKHTITHARQCGAVGIGIIAVLVVIEMIVVVSVITGSLTHDLTLQRLNTNQAFYAAEAGMALGVREMWINSDEDGDGTVGSISDDGNNANDPVIGQGTVHVSKTVNGSTTTLISRGTSSQAFRKISLDFTSQ